MVPSLFRDVRAVATLVKYSVLCQTPNNVIRPKYISNAFTKAATACNLKRFYSDQTQTKHDQEVSDTETSRLPGQQLTVEERKKQMILAEIEIMRQSGSFYVPEKVEDKFWGELLKLDSAAGRKRYYKYLRKRELAILNELEKKEQRRLEREKKLEEIKNNPNDHIEYGLNRNTIFIYVRDSTMVKHYNNNLAHAVLYGQDLVFDMSYEQHMTSRETRNCIDQLQLCYGINKVDDDPFHIHFCNVPEEKESSSADRKFDSRSSSNNKTDFGSSVDGSSGAVGRSMDVAGEDKAEDSKRDSRVTRDSSMIKRLKLSVPPLSAPKPLMTVTQKSYLDLFPKKSLVYLTPDCKEDLNFSHDDVYIVGAYVDKGPSKPISLAIAKEQGLRIARLPFDRYLEWGHGHKSLTLDQMIKILLTVKNTGDWLKAFKHIPRRKLYKPDPVKSVQRRRRDSIFGGFID